MFPGKIKWKYYSLRNAEYFQMIGLTGQNRILVVDQKLLLFVTNPPSQLFMSICCTLHTKEEMLPRRSFVTGVVSLQLSSHKGL